MSEVDSQGRDVTLQQPEARAHGMPDAARLAELHQRESLAPPSGPWPLERWWRFRTHSEQDHAAFVRELGDLRVVLEDVYQRLPSSPRELSGAQRWLYDNDYLVWRALRMAERDLPRGFHRRLPLLADGRTRIAALTSEFLALSPAGARLPALSRFVADYQERTPLDLAELWVLPTYLRVAAIRAVTDAPDDEAVVADAVMWLHAIEQHDWTDLVESMSLVERLLADDPAGYYARMDEATRDRYRKAVEVLARRSRLSQVEVCDLALAAARASAPEDRHVGTHLLGVKRRGFARSLGVGGPAARLGVAARRQAGALYLTAMIVVAAAVALPLYLYAAAVGVRWLAPLLVLALAVPVWMAGEALVHRLAVFFARPRFLPKLDLGAGVPAEAKTMVVVPCLLSSSDQIDALFAQLERHEAGNSDPNVEFALLADLADAEQQHLPGDAALLRRATDALASLRQRKAASGFHLLTRERRYNPSEGCWMGWERKRGKLMQFNELLLEGDTSNFQLHHSSPKRFRGFSYVLTLDADTALPPQAAAALIGTLAHPLNRARLSPRGRVTSGYTVLQPRIEFLPTSAERTRFSRWFTGSDGLDLYTRAVSDPYMDLFGEGLYAGKGIYDVAAFTSSLRDRVPENAILSHDLFEGGSGRAGLVTDMVLYESVPESYLAHSERAGRWIRGDWQLWPFLFDPGLSWVARWAARQNLLRSLLPVFYLLTLLLGWTVLPGRPAAWTLIVLLLSATPFLIGVLDALRGTGESGRPRMRDLGGVTLHASRWLFELMVLPHAAVVAASAVGLTLRRLFFERRGLLSWRSAADAERDVAHTGALGRWGREMAAAPVTAALTALLLLALGRGGALVAAPFLLAWAAAPLVAWNASRPVIRERLRLTAAQQRRVRRVARRTWLFFERFVGPEDNWLPPDHFQEHPNGSVAHRTSPTNIGLLLTTTLGAHDLGFLGARTMLARLRSTLSAMERMERYRGHLLNWYDTKTLAPLAPRYVSTVDSGNLLGSLMVLKAGCAELLDEPVIGPTQRDGLLSLVELYRAAAASLPGSTGRLDEAFAALEAALGATPSGPAAWWDRLREIAERRLPEVDDQVLALVREAAERVDHRRLAELGIWAGRLHAHVQELQRDLESFMPWLAEEHRAGAGALGAATPTFRQLGPLLARYRAQLALEPGAEALGSAVDEAARLVESLTDDLGDLARRAERFFEQTEFGFLYDHGRSVFRIGFDVDNSRLDTHAYDLLASEARIASFLAIATRQAPPAHWLHLARPLSLAGGRRTVLSWSGTMFEYLMPVLFMRLPEDGLQWLATWNAIEQQIAYGAEKGVPWGISESAFALTDANLNYQYRAFGVPALALARDPGADLVVAPYATLMALQLAPRRALANLDRLEKLGGAGLYGFYDALDFTPARRARGGSHTVVRTYMAHHHGMSFMAIANLLGGEQFVRRFHADARVQSADYLLHEGAPTSAPLVQLERRHRPQPLGDAESAAAFGPREVPVRTTASQVTTLSNGDLTTLLTNTGGGFSRWRGVDLTRWRNDPTQEKAGHWLYLADLSRGAYWSATRRPAPQAADKESVTFQPHKVEYRREVDGVASRLEVSVAPDDDVEIRRLELNELAGADRRLTLTSYAEVVLTEHAADARHPVFSSLFVESSFDAELGALIFRRRRREADDAPRFLLHMVVSRDPLVGPLEYETDRREFLGRGNDVSRPSGALRGSLAGTLGATLDPIAALRATVSLAPRGSAALAWVTVAAGSRPALLELARRYRHWDSLETAVAAAGEAERRALPQQGVAQEQLPLLDTLLSRVLFPTTAARGPHAARLDNYAAQPGLWAFGISGDNPILLVKVGDVAKLDTVRLALAAHRRWRQHGLKIDLVILDLSEGGYRQGTHEAVRAVVDESVSGSWLGRSGGIFLLGRARLDAGELALLEAVAAVSLDPGADLEAVLAPPSETGLLPAFTPSAPDLAAAYVGTPLTRPDDLEFDNGFGGFAAGGAEYVIYSQADDAAPPTPAPWVNVIANQQLGCLVSEAGSSTTWAVNSSENRLTPWSNDPVADPSGEVLYLRDEETARVWTATPRPAPGPGGYRTRHAAGMSTFEHVSHGLEQELTLFVPPDAPVKLVRLRLTNLQPRPRRLTATYYLQWVLGTTPEDNRHHVVTWYDAEHQALMARNPFRGDFAPQVAFLAGSQAAHGFTANRTEFIGREGSLERPAGLSRIGLGGDAGPTADPCAALQLHLDLEPGASQTVHFVLGRGADLEHARALLAEFRDAARAERALSDTAGYWDELLGAVEVSTPEPAFDVMLNRWLLYQAVAGRLWGRAGFYQASGAFGFRDQLQDVMALLHVRPEWTRAQLLNAARHQFEEGDVLHWWHPPRGQGVRTRFSDDLVWLPYVAAMYVEATGDAGVLDEQVEFLSAPELPAGIHESYDLFPASERSGSLFEHCVKALERASTVGAHGLPLMGSGDWNDGMSRVGAGGRGESVWLAFFLATTLRAFAGLCDERGEAELAGRLRAKAAAYQAATEANAWDGAWYLRAFYDDGTPLGSHTSDEAQIDVIAQAWAVLSGEADAGRREQAMRSAEERLVKDDEALVLLLTPPFDNGRMDPGYIKGYPPGVRENGGQYTHGAIWFAWATAAQGGADRAMELFRMLNPLERTLTRRQAAHYRVEPYVVAADVYGWPPHVGRGGWTWYTGSAGWLYRLGVERLLGLTRRAGGLDIRPCVPADWPGFTVSYRHGSSRYLIEVVRAGADGPTQGMQLDGRDVEGTTIPLHDTGATHRVRVVLPRA